MALAEAALQSLEPNIRTYIEGLESSLRATEIRYDHLKEEYRLLVYKRFARSAKQIDPPQEELSLLTAMNRTIGGIHINDDLPRLRATVVVIQEVFDREALDLRPIVKDLVVPAIACPFASRTLQSLQRTAACQRLAVISGPLSFAALHIVLLPLGCKQRVVAQLVMIVDILVPEADPIDPLRQHLANTVLTVTGVTTVDEALGE